MEPATQSSQSDAAPPVVLYERMGPLFRPLPAVRGPWLPGTQNGAAVAALTTSLLESTPTRVPMIPMSLHVEFLQPVPMKEFTVDIRVVRDGQRLQILQARLRSGDTDALLATLTRLRSSGEAEAPLHPPASAPAAAPAPETLQRYRSASPYFDFVDCRIASGGFNEQGPGRAWMRMTGQFIAGAAPTPLACATLMADAASGLSSIVPRADWSYPNVSLSLHLHRSPRGPWLMLDSRTFAEGGGVAQTVSTLGDQAGPFGRAQQALILERRTQSPST